VGIRDETRAVVAYVGKLSRRKGVDDLLLAARDIVRAEPSVELVLAGGWDPEAYQADTEQFVRESDLSSFTHFPGPISGETKATLLARAWVLVVPSHSEGHPWIILEAMSAGVPVVTTDTGATAETVLDGICGFVVPVGNSRALAERVITILQDPDLWIRMSRESEQRYRDRYTVEQTHAALAQELCLVASED
jgi:hypothetical protein